MSFFARLATFYDELFPYNPQTLDFIHTYFLSNRAMDLADVGCGTGQYAIELANRGHTVVGIDLDAEMVKKAQCQAAQHSDRPIRFLTGDMRQLSSLISPVQGIYCIGNTMANLTDKHDIVNTLKEFYDATAPGGSLLLQLVNFDRYIYQGTLHLPVIQRSPNGPRLIRTYLPSSNGLVEFHMELSIFNASNEIIETYSASTMLYPITQEFLESQLTKAGYTHLFFRGGFDQSTFRVDSPAMIVLATRT
jgi:SAM-dependent methyltransferase